MAGYVQLNTIRFQCQVLAGNADFHPLGSLPNCLTQSLRILCAGTVIENLDAVYNRTFAMFERCLPRSAMVTAGIEGGAGLLKPYGSDSGKNDNVDVMTQKMWEDKQRQPIGAQRSVTCSGPLLSGHFKVRICTPAIMLP